MRKKSRKRLSKEADRLKVELKCYLYLNLLQNDTIPDRQWLNEMVILRYSVTASAEVYNLLTLKSLHDEG